MDNQNQYFRIVSDEEQLIMERFRPPLPGDLDIKRYSSATIAQRISYGRMPITSRKVSLVMKNLGYHSERDSQGCFYRLYEYKPDEQKMAIAMTNAMKEPEKQQDAVCQELPF